MNSLDDLDDFAEPQKFSGEDFSLDLLEREKRNQLGGSEAASA